jgi:6-phosphogluconolactonase (cycloisomerase 2 family)
VIGLALIWLLWLSTPATALPGASGRLAFVGTVHEAPAGAVGLRRPVALAISPDGAHLYTASAADDAVAVFARDPMTGRLTFIEAQLEGVAGVTGIGGPAGPRAITLSPDGRHVYVAAAGDDAVAVFSRDPATGRLAFLEAQVDGVGGIDGLDGAWTVALDPGGRHLYAAGFLDRGVALFDRDSTTGRLAFREARFNGVGGITGLDDP